MKLIYKGLSLRMFGNIHHLLSVPVKSVLPDTQIILRQSKDARLMPHLLDMIAWLRAAESLQ